MPTRAEQERRQKEKAVEDEEKYRIWGAGAVIKTSRKKMANEEKVKKSGKSRQKIQGRKEHK